MTGKKRRILGLILFFLSVIGYPSDVFGADFSQGLIIRIINAPKDPYYLEVLTRNQVIPTPTDTPSLDYPKELAPPVAALTAQGWIPFHEAGAPLHYHGILGEDYGDYREHRFYAPGLGRDFIFLMVGKDSGKVTISPVLQKTMAEQIVDYDYATGLVRPLNGILGYLLMFLTIFLPAVVTKLTLLGVFKIPYRDNWRIVLLTSLASAVFVIAGSGRILVDEGKAPALTGTLITLPILILFEFLLYCWKFENSDRRRILGFTSSANLISMLIYLMTLVTSHRMFLAGF